MTVTMELFCESCGAPAIGPQDVECRECNTPGRLNCVECCSSALSDRPRKCKYLVAEAKEAAFEAQKDRKKERLLESICEEDLDDPPEDEWE